MCAAHRVPRRDVDSSTYHCHYAGVPTYSLNELAQLADVTPRTIRFYIAQGLLPAPDAQGPSTRYTDEHLVRLRAIKKLQAAHLPLAEIRRQLSAMPVDELHRVAERPVATPLAAVEYIRDVLEAPLTFARGVLPAPAAAPAAAPPPAAVAAPEQTRSQWERISLDPDIELHVRRPLTRHQNKRVERLIAIARELFEED